MLDLASIQAALASIKTASEIARLIRSADHSLETADHKMRLAELMEALAEAKIQIAGIQDVVLEKDRRIRTLEQAADISTRLRYQAPFYWLLPLEGDQADGPFCQQCQDKDGKLIRLQGQGNGIWDCMTCKSRFRDKTHRPVIIGHGVRRRSFEDS